MRVCSPHPIDASSGRERELEDDLTLVDAAGATELDKPCRG
jgi:hypothetical protein